MHIVHLFFIQLLFVGVRKKVTSCCKRAVYRIPLIREMVNAAPVDAIFFKLFPMGCKELTLCPWAFV